MAMHWLKQKLGRRTPIPALLLVAVTLMTGTFPSWLIEAAPAGSLPELSMANPGTIKPAVAGPEIDGRPAGQVSPQVAPAARADRVRQGERARPDGPGTGRVGRARTSGQGSERAGQTGQSAPTGQTRLAAPVRGSLTPAEWELLARAVHAEARGEPLAGQVAVAAVILNRRDDPRFPRRIEQIIYQPGAFEAVTDGQINLKPDATAYRAVALAWRGWDPSGGALYYYNPARTSNRWIWNRPVIKVIGRHWFAR